MSRIGKQQIKIPDKTEVKISDDQTAVVVKGPLGEISRPLARQVSIKIEDGEVKVSPVGQSQFANALWGTYASHLVNMIKGVNEVFEKKLQIEGIGYKAELAGQNLNMSLGFSHPVSLKIPEDIKVDVQKNLITISGVNKESVGAFAAKIRSKKKPEPYKGKGIRYVGEYVRTKQGKKSV